MNKTDKIEFLSKNKLFRGIPITLLQKMADSAKHRHLKRYDFAYLPDAPANEVYLLVSGGIKTGTFSGEGREIIKEILSEGVMFGDLALAGEEKRSEFAQALCEGAECLVLQTTDFQKFMQESQLLMYACMQHITWRLQRTEERIAQLVAKDARERIIAFIQETACKGGRKVGFETLVRHQLTQQDIASLTGTSRQTVTTVLNELKRHNIIHFGRNKILIRDVNKLA